MGLLQKRIDKLSWAIPKHLVENSFKPPFMQDKDDVLYVPQAYIKAWVTEMRKEFPLPLSENDWRTEDETVPEIKEWFEKWLK